MNTIKRPQKPNIFFRILPFIILSLCGVSYLTLVIGSTYEAAVFPHSPQRVTLAQAVELYSQHKPVFLIFEKSLYVSVTDAVWECASLKQQGHRTLWSDKRHTDVIFTDAQETAVVFVELEGFHTCRELQGKEVAGELQSFTRRPFEYQSDTKGLVTIDKDSTVRMLSLCTHCTASEAWLYPVFFFLLPFVMWGILKLANASNRSRVSDLSKPVDADTISAK